MPDEYIYVVLPDPLDSHDVEPGVFTSEEQARAYIGEQRANVWRSPRGVTTDLTFVPARPS